MCVKYYTFLTDDQTYENKRQTDEHLSAALSALCIASAGRHSFFRAVGSWSLDCQR